MKTITWNLGEVLINKSGSSLLVLARRDDSVSLLIMRSGYCCNEIKTDLITCMGYSTEIYPKEWL